MSWLALAALIIGAVGVLTRLVAIERQFWIILSTGSLYLVLFAPLAVLLFALASNPVGLLLAILLTVLVGVLHAPMYIRRRERGPGPTIRVLTSNLLIGRANAATLMGSIRRHDVELLLVQELTEEAVGRLRLAGIEEVLPHSFLQASGGGEGTGIWSAHPLSETISHDGFGFKVLSARLDRPAGPRPVVYSVHLEPPWPRPSAAWSRELPLLAGLLHAHAGPVIVGGDFNATLDHAQFRRLLRHGYVDAGLRSGLGPRFSWPASPGRVPLIGLDHVLLHSARARSIRTLRVPGSDHRGVLAEVVLSESSGSGTQRPIA